MKFAFSKKGLRKVVVLSGLLGVGAFYGMVTVGAPVTAAPEASPPPKVALTKEEKRRKLIDEFFAGPIITIEIKMEPDQVERIKRDERNYAEATLIEGDKIYKSVGLKLKGSAGSFQGIDAKPGLSLSFDKFKGAAPFHGQKRMHLNNCAQDGTYLNELISCLMAREAGVPASRCTHAFVKLNGRDLGLYVVKEAFTRDFLSSFFKNPDGNLWDGGFCQEINENMQKDQGDPEDKEPLKKLMAACREGDAAKRWTQLTDILDTDLFARFCAIEDFVGHWDGYNFNRNNYRLYQDADSGKFCFFLHGTDQTFNDANAPIKRDFPSMVGSAFMRCPQGAQLYREKADEIYGSVLKEGAWGERVAQEGKRVQEALAAKDSKLGKEYEGRIREARNRVESRIMGIGKQLGDLPKPPQFDKNNVYKLTDGWRSQQSGGDLSLDEASKDGKNCYHLQVKSSGVGSWRREVNLPQGKYRFECQVSTAGVQAADGGSGRGAHLRISGGQAKNFAEGDTPWKTLAFEFEANGSPVVLVAELRAQKGDAWFEKGSMRLVWLK